MSLSTVSEAVHEESCECGECQEKKFIKIRASGLPNSTDCWLKWAVGMALDNQSNLAPVFTKHGYDLPTRSGDGIGASIGTACHEAYHQYFQAKIDGYEGVNLEQVAIGKFRRIVEGGKLEYDKKLTKTQEVAEEQIRRMVAAYEPHAALLKPKRVEFRVKARPDPVKRYLVTGHPDIFEHGGKVRDEKYGSNLSRYEGQLGTYSLAMKSAGEEVNELYVDWTPRCTVNKPQRPTEIIQYDVNVCETAAHYLIEEAMWRIERFKETGDLWSFMPNNNSNLCSPGWCRAHSTPLCCMGKPVKESD